MAALNGGLDTLLRAGEAYATDNDLILTKADIVRLNAQVTAEKYSPTDAAAYGFYLALGVIGRDTTDPEPWH